jgi:hypothetical protein
MVCFVFVALLRWIRVSFALGCAWPRHRVFAGHSPAVAVAARCVLLPLLPLPPLLLLRALACGLLRSHYGAPCIVRALRAADDGTPVAPLLLLPLHRQPLPPLPQHCCC